MELAGQRIPFPFARVESFGCTMNEAELLETLRKLELQVAQTSEVDDGTRQSLRNLISDIQTKFASEEQVNAEPEPTLNQRMTEVMADFEAKHPQLTATLSQIADRLADMGI